jgi:hypothetical protein
MKCPKCNGKMKHVTAYPAIGPCIELNWWMCMNSFCCEDIDIDLDLDIFEFTYGEETAE